MAESSAISWTDATFNPWIGCTKVSPGCNNCYAARQDGFRHWTPQGWGAGMPRKRTSVQLWGGPKKWNAQPFAACSACGWRGVDPHDGTPGWIECPACGKEALVPARRRVFCASLADVFDNEVDPQWRADLFKLIVLTPNLDWLLLTKRIGNACKMIADAIGQPVLNYFGPLSNVWLGATVVNQEEADRDIPKLLAVPARVRFLSCEPLLGPVNISRALPGVDWVIVGGESGPKARPMHPDWVRDLRGQCALAGVAFHFKQWGEFVSGDQAACSLNDCYEKARTGGWVSPDGSYTLGESSVPSFAGSQHVFKVGAASAGRVLDGVTHDAFPEVACAT